MNVLSGIEAVFRSAGNRGEPARTLEEGSPVSAPLDTSADAIDANPIAGEMGGLAARFVEWLRTRKTSKGQPRESPAQGSILTGMATTTVVGAVEGTLKGKSLDGALKEAQVREARASARQKNADAQKLEAEAEKLRAETEKLRQDSILERLERSLTLMERIAAMKSDRSVRSGPPGDGTGGQDQHDQ